ncbi:hypothetical protein CFter6_4462 [Collimonas fungivorans]|uniref:Uncharacterized protein n=1 Tax=Collimonas fungivorans TaxID=158899 RepID=A0A127PH59_9BURK|nr:hypothetical protein CFter6_4462 [Collimonas fungivorans]
MLAAHAYHLYLFQIRQADSHACKDSTKHAGCIGKSFLLFLFILFP